MMILQKDDDWRNARVQNPLSEQQDIIEICLAHPAECCAKHVVVDESSIAWNRWPLFGWHGCLERPLVQPAAEADAAATTTVNKRQHRTLVMCSTTLVVLLSSLLIAVGIAFAVVTAKSNMAARTNEIEFTAFPTAGAESASISLATRKDLEACSNDISHPPLPGKKGAAFTLRDEGQRGSWVENLPKVIQLKPYWNYSWGTKRIAQQPDDIEFVPMLWGWGGNAEKLAATIANDILPQVQAGRVKRLLGFNEPDFAQQANMTVEAALAAWPLLEETNLPLISPSCGHPEREVRNVGFAYTKHSLTATLESLVDAIICHGRRRKMSTYGMGGCALVRWGLLSSVQKPNGIASQPVPAASAGDGICSRRLECHHRGRSQTNRGVGARFYETGLAVARGDNLDCRICLVFLQQVVSSRNELGPV
jgi:Glycosyl hydrolase catalytic core